MISLKVQQLGRSYGYQSVFDQINFTHQSGVLGIAGPNGSGKSTLLKCIAGLLQPSTGRVIWEVDDQELNVTDLKSQLGYSAPYVSLYKELTVRENMEFLARLRKMNIEQQALTRLFERVDLIHVADRLFGRLSTGQQQRARLASSLFHNPSALLWDEPGSNLDKKGRDLIEHTARLFGSDGRFLIIASNDEQELALCDRIFSVEKEDFI